SLSRRTLNILYATSGIVSMQPATPMRNIASKKRNSAVNPIFMAGVSMPIVLHVTGEKGPCAPLRIPYGLRDELNLLHTGDGIMLVIAVRVLESLFLLGVIGCIAVLVLTSI